MASTKFMTSVADVYAYDANDNLVFSAKTLLDSSIENSLGSAPVRGGRGNQLLYTYYHTAELTVNLTDTQWNLGMLGSTIGSDALVGGFSYYGEENVAVSGSVTAATGTVSGTPLAFAGETTIYGWATSPTGDTERVSFTGQTFTLSKPVASTETWCVRYYKANTSIGQGIIINANMIPRVLKVVMETQLNSSDSTKNKIGIVQIIVPRLQLSGAFTISMTADGIANTPLTGTALAYTEPGSAGCAVDSYYAKIVEVIDATNWYDNVTALAIDGGNFDLAVGGTETLSVWAIPSVGSAFKVSNSVLTFSSTASNIATVGAHTGVVSGVASGSAGIEAEITSASSISGSATVTVS